MKVNDSKNSNISKMYLFSYEGNLTGKHKKIKQDYVTKEIRKTLELLKTMWEGLNKRQGHCGKVPLCQSALFLRLAGGSKRGVRRKI